ncbi:MAG: phosphatase PAP2 family protein [Patescibacteria group bacterium]|nr:phosphatase PAP2 family protein [Patescibacteria group bacterium]
MISFWKPLFSEFRGNIKRIFTGRNLWWHLLAIVSTYAIAVSGFDWLWFNYFRGTVTEAFLFPAVILGALLPVAVPLGMLAYASVRRNARMLNAAFGTGQAALLGFLISSTYKAFTGRAHPLFRTASMIDISKDFNFGFLRGGVFWGWPSSHTTVAFAAAFALLTLYPEKRAVRYAALAYAWYVGLGVSMSIHWFSDFVAGAIIGTVIGLVVGRSFLARAAGYEKAAG